MEPIVNIKDKRFVYVPPASQERDGVLSRWLRQRWVEKDALRERERELEEAFAELGPKPHAG